MVDMNKDNGVIVESSFSDDEYGLFDDVSQGNFDSSEILDLKVEGEELTKNDSVDEIISYELVKKNLAYKLPYQINGALRILRDLNGNALLADEVGLGKTITSALVVKECLVRGMAKTVLILTPPSLVDQWVAEMKEKFDLDFKIVEKPEDWSKGDLLIASIDRVKTFNRELEEFRHKQAFDRVWDIVMVDEAHKLKERSTVRWRFADALRKKRFLLLTATPFQNDLIELYNLLHLLKKGHLGTIKDFRKKFLNQGNKRYPMNPKELRRKLDEVMVRRRRDESGIAYMKRVPRIVAIEQTEQEKRIYDKICELLKSEYFNVHGEQINGRLIVFALLPKITSSSKSAMESLKKIMENPKYHYKTRDLAAEIYSDYRDLEKDSKIEKLVEIVTDLRVKDPEAKVLIYTKHPTTLKYIVEKLAPLNLKISEFMGGLSREEKTEKIQAFRDGADVLICTDTGAEGLNLQFCNNLINYDLPWNPMSVEQRIGRLDRIGQTKDMNIFSFATKGTMEEHVVDLIINKMCCVGLVIGELPIILFNLGLDSEGRGGSAKIEETLMNAFIDSKGTLDKFANGVNEISKKIQEGLEDYEEQKDGNRDLLDVEKN